MSKTKNILYLTRNGLLEPLGQSQILAYLAPLSKEFKFHIISFEKTKELEKEAGYEEIKKLCSVHNIKWTPLGYRKGVRVIGIIVGFIDLIKKIIQVNRKEKIDLIHARSYFPSFIALFMHFMLRIPFIFDMRALWPEELVVAGRLKKASIGFRLVKFLEGKCLAYSKAIVSLTKAAVLHLEIAHPQLPIKEKTTVIPTCTDLNRFSLKELSGTKKDQIVVSCIGTLLSGWFKIELLRKTLSYLLENYEAIQIEIITRDETDSVLKVIDPNNRWGNRISIGRSTFKEMPKRLKKHDGSIFFFNSDISKLGSSPTRMGELLGTGVPILANAGVGDVGAIVSSTGIGILVEKETNQAIEEACKRFITLIYKEGIAEKCRVVAESMFSLEAGVDKYRKIYNSIH